MLISVTYDYQNESPKVEDYWPLILYAVEWDEFHKDWKLILDEIEDNPFPVRKVINPKSLPLRNLLLVGFTQPPPYLSSTYCPVVIFDEGTYLVTRILHVITVEAP